MTHDNYMNISYLPENENMMKAEPNIPAKSLIEETKKHRALYPEIHYKLHPFISVTADAIDASGMEPTQDEFDNICDNIYDEFCKIHPEMDNYMKAGRRDDDPMEAVPAFDGFGRGPRFGGFRRRGIGRDLIGALLLSELLGRRRFFHPFFPFSPF